MEQIKEKKIETQEVESQWTVDLPRARFRSKRWLRKKKKKKKQQKQKKKKKKKKRKKKKKQKRKVFFITNRSVKYIEQQILYKYTIIHS
ncbi:hypothetical protein ANTQUA_LOCUS4452 [Anthophora quadrimaculata]